MASPQRGTNGAADEGLADEREETANWLVVDDERTEERDDEADSTRQLELQPSPEAVLWSSHCSPLSLTPSPQRNGVQSSRQALAWLLLF
jgi:hypothetical protein